MTPQSGLLIDIELIHACAYPQENWLVMGTLGGLVSDCNTIHWKYFDPDEVSPLVLDPKPTPDRSYNREILPWYEQNWVSYHELNDGMQPLYRDLYKTMRHYAPLVITAESVRRQIYILNKCRLVGSRK